MEFGDTPRLHHFGVSILHCGLQRPGFWTGSSPHSQLMNPGVDPPAYLAHSPWPKPRPSNQQGSWTQVRDGCVSSAAPVRDNLYLMSATKKAFILPWGLSLKRYQDGPTEVISP